MKKQIGIKSLNLTDLLNEETEFLPLMSDEDEAKISKEDAPDVIPILPLRNTVLFVICLINILKNLTQILTHITIGILMFQALELETI